MSLNSDRAEIRLSSSAFMDVIRFGINSKTVKPLSIWEDISDREYVVDEYETCLYTIHFT
jgi:hypothetical protein